jgi:hypothetical protein
LDVPVGDIVAFEKEEWGWETGWTGAEIGLGDEREWWMLLKYRNRRVYLELRPRDSKSGYVSECE